MKNKTIKSTSQTYSRKIYLSTALSLLVMVIFIIYPQKGTRIPAASFIFQSSQKMMQSISEIKKHHKDNKIPINSSLDPNQTGLIGESDSEITTTLGNLPAKRTTINPNFAGIIASLIIEAGIKPGQTIVINCSASFPALMIAALSAAETLGFTPLLHLSIGSSSYGANSPDFHILKILNILTDNKILDTRPLSISMGGNQDVGREMAKEVKKKIIQEINEAGIPFFSQPDLRKNVTEKIKLFKNHSTDGGIALFINIGGNYSSLGTSSKILKLAPGLNFSAQLPSINQRGLIFEMISQQIPSIHLLFIRGLSSKYNLPWDPIPLPEPKRINFAKLNKKNPLFIIILTVIYYSILLMIWLKNYSLRKESN